MRTGAVVAAILLICAANGAGLETGGEDEGSITLGASLVKPYQYSGDAKEFTVAPERAAGAATEKKAGPAQALPEPEAGGDDGANRP